MKKKFSLFCVILLSFLLGAFCVIVFAHYKFHFAERTVRNAVSAAHNYSPYEEVNFAKSSLPIIKIDCGKITKEQYIPATMRIIEDDETVLGGGKIY